MRLSHTPLILTSFAIGCSVGVLGFTAGTLGKPNLSASSIGRMRGLPSPSTREVPSETDVLIGKQWDADAEEFSELLRTVPMSDRQSLLPIRIRDDGILLCARLLDLSWTDLQKLLGDDSCFALRLAREENPMVLNKWMQQAVAEGHASQLAEGWWDLHPQGKQLFLDAILPRSADHPELLDSRGAHQALETADVPQLTVALRSLEKLESSQGVTRAVKTATERIAALDPALAAEIVASTSNPDIREALMKRLPAQVTDNLLCLPPARPQRQASLPLRLRRCCPVARRWPRSRPRSAECPPPASWTHR
jgi:hypothetical protein